MLIPWDLLLFVIGVIGMPGAPLKWKPGLGTRINICRALLKYRVSPNLCKAITGVCVLVDRDWAGRWMAWIRHGNAVDCHERRRRV